MLTDGVGRALPNRELVLTINGEELTSLSVAGNGSFTAFVPISPDMHLGPLLIEVSYEGEQFVLPSNSSVVFTVFSPVFVTIEEPHPVAVGDTLTISGRVKDNLEDGWLGSHTIEVFVDGLLVGMASSVDNGTWSLNWTLPESMEIGNHSVSAVSPAQGFYRQGSTESSFTVSYHTSISLQVEEVYATRGGEWNFTGRLFESDTGFEQGLDGREVLVLLDGSIVETVITEAGGLFSYSQRVQYSLSRGSHNVTFQYGGEFLYLPTDSVLTVFALSDICLIYTSDAADE